tara:strand:- start:681 stop:1211 length:531 start_codon:yes stop_codon:yes gene_type:complete
MVHDWWLVFNPIFGLVSNVTLQILSHRFFSGLTLLRSVFFGFGVGFVFVIGCEILRYDQGYYARTGDFWAIMITNSITYAFIGYCYFSLIGLGETARRVRLLKDLYAAPEGLNLSDILAGYSAKDMVDMRLDRLLHNGQVIQVGNRFFIGKQLMLFLTKFSIFMKLIVLGKKSEFD